MMMTIGSWMPGGSTTLDGLGATTARAKSAMPATPATRARKMTVARPPAAIARRIAKAAAQPAKSAQPAKPVSVAVATPAGRKIVKATPVAAQPAKAAKPAQSVRDCMVRPMPAPIKVVAKPVAPATNAGDYRLLMPKTIQANFDKPMPAGRHAMQVQLAGEYGDGQMGDIQVDWSDVWGVVKDVAKELLPNNDNLPALYPPGYNPIVNNPPRYVGNPATQPSQGKENNSGMMMLGAAALAAVMLMRK